MMAAALNPEDFNYFRTKRRQVDTTHSLGQAQNAYQSAAAGNQFTRNVGDLARQYGRAVEKHPWGFGARGLLNSGIYQKSVADLATDGFVRPYTNMVGQHQDVQGGFALAGQQLGRIRGESMADISSAEQSRLAMEQIAAAIRGAA